MESAQHGWKGTAVKHFSRHELTSAICQHPQDPHKIEPVNLPAWMGHEPHT